MTLASISPATRAILAALSPKNQREAILRYAQQRAQRAAGTALAPTFRGAALRLQACDDPEVIISGPAETGKTFAALWRINQLALHHKGFQGAIIRKTRESLSGTALETFKKIIQGDPRVSVYGGEYASWYDYPETGARIWIGGIDKPGKVLSSERDVIYVNQAEEMTLEDWETLTTRTTGRAGNLPFGQLMGDCNPSQSMHWIKQRQSLTLLESRHEDNPRLYTDDGVLTEAGQRSMASLDRLTGVRYLRLRKGLWVNAEGVVYDDYDPLIHLIDRFEIPAGARRIRSIDFGYNNPFSCSWWALIDDILIRYRQIYMTKRLVEDHAKQINKLSEGERIETTVCDHDAEDRATLERYGVETRPASKAISVGIQAVQSRMKKAGNGKPRIVFMRDSLVEVDQSLCDQDGHPIVPINTEQELEVYSWPKGADGKSIKEVPIDKDNHGCDEMRYAVMYFEMGGTPLAVESADRPQVHAARPKSSWLRGK